MLLPFALSSFQGAAVLGWQGQEHATYGMGLYAPGVAERIDRETLDVLLDQIRDRVPGISALRLKSQPLSWQGIANPFARLGAQEGASRSYQLGLEADFEAQLARTLKKDTRGKLRRAGNALAALPGFSVGRAATQAERLALLDSFFAQKARQLAERGIAEPVREARRSRPSTVNSPAARQSIRRCWIAMRLSAAGEVVATATSIGFQNQSHLLTLSLGAGDPGLLKHSPGLVLMREVMAAAACDGVTAYDFGAGDGQHKSIWRPEPVPLFETHVALNIRGYAASITAASGSAVKRVIKNHPALWQAAQSARRLLRATRD